jgi:hypothetical protein
VLTLRDDKSILSAVVTTTLSSSSDIVEVDGEGVIRLSFSVLNLDTPKLLNVVHVFVSMSP